MLAQASLEPPIALTLLMVFPFKVEVMCHRESECFWRHVHSSGATYREFVNFVPTSIQNRHLGEQ
jgi:hypothetical protein